MLHIQKQIQKNANKEKAKVYQRFFKTGKWEYGEGDVFLGLTVPQSRIIAKQFLDLSFVDIETLLQSKYHEERLIGLLILVENYKNKKTTLQQKKKIYHFYIQNTAFVNNWDLVDSSADKIVGEFLSDKKKDLLHKLVASKNIWERRIAIVATFAFIRKNQFQETFQITEKLLNDNHDLLHKAAGWMLREAGKRNQEQLELFLQQHYKKMPRTMLRYSIERFDEGKRKRYLIGTM